MKNIAVFASGSGTNAEKLIRTFADSADAKVVVVFCNRPDAYVLKRAQQLGIPSITFNRHDFYASDSVLKALENYSIDLIVLAGFLWLLPGLLIESYPQRIVNIHPALLPNYGGKGMYGHFVHEAVIANEEKESGITIHYVDEHYDQGQIIYQHAVAVAEDETPDSLAEKIHALEYAHFPRVIQELVAGL